MVSSGFNLTVKSKGELPVFSMINDRFNLSAVSTFTSLAVVAGPTGIPSWSIKSVENDSSAFTVRVTVSDMFNDRSV